MIFACFPRAILFEPNILNENLETYEQEIKTAISKVGTMRDSMLNVDSTHKLRTNIFEVARLKGLRQAIFSHAKEYLSEIGYKELDTLHFENCWANISSEGDYLFPHLHNGSLLSGVYYVKCDMRDRIKFYNTPSMLPEPTTYTQYNAQFAEYSCVPGSLLMFTSDMMHGTDKQIGEEKIAISFNLNL
jgi:uncharacterized protein (TIGR02466 family)|tara:strand:- start:212 stop:775 length:564 start_codon:yes stop_codon:yes gene_type:complete